MLGKLTLAAGLLALGIMLTPHIASAATVAPGAMPLAVVEGGTLVQKTQWGRCREWRHECARRWGWRTPMFFRCMGRHGC